MKNNHMTVREAIQMMKEKGSILRKAYPPPVEGMPPFTYHCTFSDDCVNREDLAELPYEFPEDLVHFWKETTRAHLFEDRDYGQWGLEILDPSLAVDATDQYHSDRQNDCMEGDLIIGRFIGDYELLMIRCNRKAEDYGHVIVVLPLDPRSNWDYVAESFAIFLDKYVKSGGDKFWIQTNG